MTRVLVTCAGSGVGQSVIDSLNQLDQYYLIGIDTNTNVYANHFCNEFYVAPSIYSVEYINFLIQLSKDNKVDIIIPGHDHELLLLSKDIEKFKKENITVLVSEPKLIEISRDKYEWYRYFSQHKCPVAPTAKVSEFIEFPDESFLPAIIKPAGGSASQGISIINSIKDLTSLNNDDIIQPYLFPELKDPNFTTVKKFVEQGKIVQISEISIQLIFDTTSDFKGLFISKNTLENGVPVYVEPIDPENFEHINDILKFVHVCKENRVIGPVNIQGRITDKGLVCFEMNMRFTGITGNRSLLGFNEVSYSVNNFLSKPSKLKLYSKNKVGVRQVACTTIPNKKTRKKTYTILGAGGYIGSEFMHQLANSYKYDRINIICRKNSINNYRDKFKNKNINIYSDDDIFCQTVYSQTDVLVNFVGALAYESDEKQFQAILFQHEQLQKIIKANIPLVINVSSQSIYNQTLDKKKDENAQVLLNSTYAFQKYLTEQFFSSIESFSPSCKSISLRLSRTIGVDYTKEDPKGGFFVKIIDSLINGNEIQIPNPENKTNLINIKDVANAILFISESKNIKSFPSVLNLGGDNLSMKEYCHKVVNTLNISEATKLIKFGDNTKVEVSSMIDSNKLNLLGLKQSYRIEDTIIEIKDILTTK